MFKFFKKIVPQYTVDKGKSNIKSELLKLKTHSDGKKEAIDHNTQRINALHDDNVQLKTVAAAADELVDKVSAVVGKL